MSDNPKSREELLSKLEALRAHVVELEAAQAGTGQDRKALRESESRYRQLYDAMPSGVAVYEAIEDGQDFLIRGMNQAGCRISKVREQDVLGKRVTQAFPGVEEFGLLEVLRRVWRTGEPEHFDEHAYQDNRLTHWAANNVYKLPSGEVVAVYNDVTERVRTGQALRESEERCHTYLTAAPLAIFVTDQSGQYLRVNPAACELTGYSQEQLLGMSVGDLHAQADAEVERAHLAQLQATGQVDAEITLSRQDGALIEVLLMAVQLPSGESLAFLQDMTELKRSEERLRRAQRLEAIGRLAGGVAHQFNNLLTVINGYSELAMDGLGRGHAIYPQIKEIARAGERAAGLAQRLLSYGRRQLLRREPLDLNALLRGMMSMLNSTIGEHITLSLDLSSDLGIIEADREYIEQIVLDLASNARDAMPQGGILTLRTANATPPGSDDSSSPDQAAASHVLLQVRDTGGGMSPDVLEHLFEPFFTTKEVGKGTGLGLSSVYGVVKQLGGEIEVSSEEGLGATFRIYFPRVAQVSPEDGSQTPVKIIASSQTILVVEDDEGVRRLTSRMLQALGYRVLVAADSAMALRLCEEQGRLIDLVLSDVAMPGINGPQLVARIRASYPEVAALYMTGYAERTLQSHGVDTTGASVIPKPFRQAELAQKVRQALGDEKSR